MVRYTFGLMENIAYYLPETFNDLFTWEFYSKFRDPVTYNIPVIGENPARFTTHGHWHRKIDYRKPRTAQYQMMEAICNDDINSIKQLLDNGFDLSSKICPER